MEAPDDKLQKCNAQLLDMHKRRKTTLKELQSLIGLLNFTCSLVLPGRAFLQRLIDLTKGVRLPHHRIRITEACRRDLQVWLQFLRDFNGRTFFLDEPWRFPRLSNFTPTLRAQRTMARFLESIGFTESALPIGNH